MQKDSDEERQKTERLKGKKTEIHILNRVISRKIDISDKNRLTQKK